jgi:hypothetical protein
MKRKITFEAHDFGVYHQRGDSEAVLKMEPDLQSVFYVGKSRCFED